MVTFINFITYLIIVFSRLPVNIGVTCAVLVAPDNGQVSVGGVTVGSTASYSCLPGYVLRGFRLRRCSSNGAWSGQDPVCEGVWV